MKKRILPLLILAFLFIAGPAGAEAEYRIILTDAQMRIVYSQAPRIAREGEKLNLLISPYEHDQKRIAVLLKENGEIARSFVAVDTPSPLGEENEQYALYFPNIREDAYHRAYEYYDELDALTTDLWYYNEKKIKLTRKERLVVVDYVNWEIEQEMNAEGGRLTYLALPDSGGKLFLFYSSPAE